MTENSQPTLEPSPWDRSLWRQIGTALLAAAAPLDAGGLARATGKDSSNIRKAAEEMAEQGLLERQPPSQQRNRPGRRSENAYSLIEGQDKELQRFLSATSSPGNLHQGQQLVFAEARESSLEDLLHVLADAELTARAAWTALCDGPRQEYLIAFEGVSPASPALDLMAALAAVDVPCRRVSISQVEPAHSFLQQVRRAARGASKASLRRNTRHVSERGDESRGTEGTSGADL